MFYNGNAKAAQCVRDAFGHPAAESTAQADAPAATVDALMYELREDGVAALATRGCQRRLAAISSDQALAVIARLNNLRARYPKITDQLILRIGDCDQ